MWNILAGVLLPFLGTSLGAACALFMRGGLHAMVQRALTGFAAGVMVAASVWSLLVPAMDAAAAGGMGQLAFVPAVAGFWGGVLFLLALDRWVPHLHQYSAQPEGLPAALQRSTLLVLAVTLHNIPEGMAVGAVFAAWLTQGVAIPYTAVVALSLGMAIQNFPEGAIISMPLRAQGARRGVAFGYGVLSGAVEPAAALLTIAAAGLVTPALPLLLSFAAGAMVYVVVEELIPEMSAGRHSNVGTLLFAAGFSLMMALGG